MPNDDPRSKPFYRAYRTFLEDQYRISKNVSDILKRHHEREQERLDIVAQCIAAQMDARAAVMAESTASSAASRPHAIAEPLKETAPPVPKPTVIRGRPAGTSTRMTDERARVWLQNMIQKHQSKERTAKDWGVSVDSIRSALDPEVGVTRTTWDEMMAAARTTWAEVVGEP